MNHRVAQYRRSAVVFAQGASCAEVLYLQQGSVKLSVLSSTGKEAIVSEQFIGYMLKRNIRIE